MSQLEQPLSFRSFFVQSAFGSHTYSRRPQKNGQWSVGEAGSEDPVLFILVIFGDLVCFACARS
jgi:hypothetical protein